MGADPDLFIDKKLAKTKQGLSFFGKEALAEYKRCFRNPETIHAMCEDYRATFGVDLEMDTKDFAAGRKIDLSGADCCGVRPAGSAATTSPVRPKSGATTRPTSSAPRRCPAGIICRKRRRRKRPKRCARFSPLLP